jgi:hypothetical protein
MKAMKRITAVSFCPPVAILNIQQKQKFLALPSRVVVVPPPVDKHWSFCRPKDKHFLSWDFFLLSLLISKKN